MYIVLDKINYIVTPDDEYVFLECNPNGQWLWIELATGFDISKVIANNLAKFGVKTESC